MTLAVLGGGPAGAATAALLAAAGRDVVLLERDAAPVDKVCGDFLSIEAQQALTRLGLDLASEGAAPIGTVRLIHGARVAGAALPFPALGLSRRRLDAALLDVAERRGATIRRGVRALALRPDGAVETSDGCLRTSGLFLATGKHELRGAARPAPRADWVGFKTYMALAPAQVAALRGAVELVLFDGGYVGLLLVENDMANISLIVSTGRLAAAGGVWDRLLATLAADCPTLAQRLEGATALLPRPLAVARLPYGFIHKGAADDLVYRVGDQAAVIPSLTGDGVALALHTAERAVRAWDAGCGPAQHHAALRRELAGQMRRAAFLHHACLTPPLQGGLVAAAQVAPWAMRLAATSTRIARRPLRAAWRELETAPSPAASGAG